MALSKVPLLLHAQVLRVLPVSLTSVGGPPYPRSITPPSRESNFHRFPIGYRIGADIVVYSWFHVKVCCVAGVGFFTDA
jgi:hypothetical protein